VPTSLNADGGCTITGPTTAAVPRTTRDRTPALTPGPAAAARRPAPPTKTSSSCGSGSGSGSGWRGARCLSSSCCMRRCCCCTCRSHCSCSSRLSTCRCCCCGCGCCGAGCCCRSCGCECCANGADDTVACCAGGFCRLTGGSPPCRGAWRCCCCGGGCAAGCDCVCCCCCCFGDGPGGWRRTPPCITRPPGPTGGIATTRCPAPRALSSQIKGSPGALAAAVSGTLWADCRLGRPS
jgi:hypothetical protein